MTEEEIKKMQEENNSLKEENKKLTEENTSLKSKNEEHTSSIKGLKDDIEKLKEEVKEGFANTQKKLPAQDNKSKVKPDLLEALIDAK